MLSAYRVLDLTDERGQLCGQILRALGAEVVLVEPPRGSPARRVGPFAGDVQDPERSLRFWAHNRGKKSVVVDQGTSEGRRVVLDLARSADILVECDTPGRLAARGLGYEDVAAVNPGIIYVSISPFGGDGPKVHWTASDLTILASSGSLVLNGDEDRPPVRPGPEGQAYFHASADAAGAALLALYERQNRSGLGQHVDVSGQQAASFAALTQLLCTPLNSTPSTRSGYGLKLAGLDVQLTFPCKDGFAICVFLFGAAIAPFTRRLMEWVHEEGMCDASTRDKDWVEYTMMLLDGREPLSEFERCKRVVSEFLQNKSKAELLDAAIARKLLIAPIMTIRDVYESEQFASRDFWEDVDHGGDIGKVRYPGAMAKLSGTPLTPLPAAPHLGEHSTEVMRERPLAPRRLQRPAGQPGGSALEGLKVLDLTWVVTGPSATRVLADYGATVVRVESVARMDTCRTLAPFRNDIADPEFSGLYHNYNAGKLGLALRLDQPAGREVLLDLARWADLLLEAYSPGVLSRWGLGYEQFRAVNPQLVMASTCLFGQNGPYAAVAGYGGMAAAAAGFHYLCGWPDRWPAGPFSAYTDTIAPRFLLTAVLAALEHRRATGQGQYIDLSQAEASMSFLTTALLDYDVNGRVAERTANEDSRFSPHGVYPAHGNDEWIAVVCETDDQWKRLCAVLGRADLAELRSDERRAGRLDIDRLMCSWTSALDAARTVQLLQARGVPAHQLNRSPDCVSDPQLQHRGHYVQVPHATQPGGVTYVEASRFRLSRTPAQTTRAAPTFGEHVLEVLSGILGYDEEQIADLAAMEVLE